MVFGACFLPFTIPSIALIFMISSPIFGSNAYLKIGHCKCMQIDYNKCMAEKHTHKKREKKKPKKQK